MGSWLRKRKRIRLDIAQACSERSGIGVEDFLKLFYDAPAPASIGDFDSQYISDAALLEEIFTDLSGATGLDRALIQSHFSRTETFPQFAERLLRAGAYAKENG
jgi:hypothetical protein